MIRFAFTLIVLLQAVITFGQRINFQEYTGNAAISLTVVENPLGLNFNRKEPMIYVGMPFPVIIGLNDLPVVVVEIDAPLEFDLTATFQSENLTLGGTGAGVPIPFALRFAYNNTGELTDGARRMAAVEVPAGFSVLTFPVQRRKAGAPMPPPTPDHGGYVRPRGKVYLYIYGSIGPIPSNAASGNYEGNINLTVDYADTSF